jgi:hypothetical protein
MIEAPIIPEKEQRRVDGIRFLAKVNPVRYDAKYVQGRLELFENIAHKINGGNSGQWYCWKKFNT